MCVWFGFCALTYLHPLYLSERVDLSVCISSQPNSINALLKLAFGLYAVVSNGDADADADADSDGGSGGGDGNGGSRRRGCSLSCSCPHGEWFYRAAAATHTLWQSLLCLGKTARVVSPATRINVAEFRLDTSATGCVCGSTNLESTTTTPVMP